MRFDPQLIFLVAAVAMFWLLVIRPQQKRSKAQATMLSALQPGAEIITIGGIYGTIVEAGEERIRIRVADGSEFEIARRAVSGVVDSHPGADDALEAPSAQGSDASQEPDEADKADGEA